MLSEIRFASRRLLQDRWSTAAAILVAALGTGLNTAVFAVAYGVLIRPLPYRDAARLAVVNPPVPLAQVDELRSRVSSFEQIAAYSGNGFTVRGLTEPRFLQVAAVDDMFFQTLGSPALAGRTFGPGDPAGVAVLSERVARQTGESMESLQGRRVTVGEIAATVIGVMPDAFAFPSQGTDVWIPARAALAIAFDGSRDARRFRLFGRLKPGVTFPRAGEDVLRVRSALDPEFKASAPARIRVESLYDALVKEARPVLVAFAAAAAVCIPHRLCERCDDPDRTYDCAAARARCPLRARREPRSALCHDLLRVHSHCVGRHDPWDRVCGFGDARVLCVGCRDPATPWRRTC